MDMRTLEVVMEIASINGEWQILGDIMKRELRGIATAAELQLLAEKIDELQQRATAVMKKNEELISS